MERILQLFLNGCSAVFVIVMDLVHYEQTNTFAVGIDLVCDEQKYIFVFGIDLAHYV